VRKRLLFCVLLLVSCNREEKQQSRPVANGGDAHRGNEALVRYGCTACHSIPGIEGPRGLVGPPLDHMAARPLIAGKFENTPQNMALWLQNPQSMDPDSAMPSLGVTPADARDMTAYLATLK
jgi:cytochrome c2